MLNIKAGITRLDKKELSFAKEVSSSAISSKYGKLLYRIAKFSRPGIIVELGTNAGVSAACLMLGANESSSNPVLYTIEGNTDLYKITKDTYPAFFADQNGEVNFIQGLFKNKLPDILSGLQSIDLLYVDGDHQKESTLQYFHWCAEKASSSSIFIFDDIYWSQGMKEAWLEITRWPKITLCLDLYRLGIVFFNPDLSKQVIRVR